MLPLLLLFFATWAGWDFFALENQKPFSAAIAGGAWLALGFKPQTSQSENLETAERENNLPQRSTLQTK
jgi:hypothetical protein